MVISVCNFLFLLYMQHEYARCTAKTHGIGSISMGSIEAMKHNYVIKCLLIFFFIVVVVV